MLFSEVYGKYYRMVEEILRDSITGELNQQRILRIVQEKGFEESVLTVPQAFRDQKWPLVDRNYHTKITHYPTMPLTTIEKQWLKSLTIDPRIRLFNPDVHGLEDVEPLITPDMFIFYDRYSDGDPYDDPDYIGMFRAILRAIRNKKKLSIMFSTVKGNLTTWTGLPAALEYSSKDDKFRLRMLFMDMPERTIPLAQIKEYRIYEESSQVIKEVTYKKQELVLEITDERNAMERFLVQFSPYEKSAEKLDDHLYRVRLLYAEDDLKEIVIQLLSFGPMLRVMGPDRVIKSMKRRVEAQLSKQLI